MRHKLVFLLLSITIGLNGLFSQEKPKVLIAIVVDQMRNDYLYKYWDEYGENGFKKLVSNGKYAKNINYTYKPTYTGPGHATIFTGATPSVHGIVGNNWYSRSENKMVYCAKSIRSEDENWYSPQRMLTRSIADEIKLFTNNKAKCYGVSLKDRGAILPAGHMADAAFWFEGDKGGWLTSDYYDYQNTNWLNKINKQDIYKSYLESGWQLSLEEKYYQEELPDDNPYEKPYLKGEKAAFPYDFTEAHKKKGDNLIKATPQGNQLLIDFAKQLVKEESIGKDEVLDFFSISFSSTDYIGHQFGVSSREVHDTYIKLDKQLAELLNFFDSEIGKENYLLFLTSDHGAGEARELLIDNNMPGGFIDVKAIKKKLEKKLQEEFGEGKYIQKLTNLNVYFTESVIKSKKRDKIINYSKAILEKQKGFKNVYSKSDLEIADDGFGEIIANGYLESESGELIILEKPNWNNYSKQGSTHGSPYTYDTHVPLVFYGWGIKAGEINEPYAVSNIASTLSNLLGISRPDGSTSKIIKGLK